MNMAWLKAALIRAVRTMAQAALASITVEQAIYSIDWKSVIALAATAGVYSLITSLAGLPEVPKEAPKDE